jgi:hypothetical protein
MDEDEKVQIFANRLGIGGAALNQEESVVCSATAKCNGCVGRAE